MVVRELLLGPVRSTDLPGVSSNVIAGPRAKPI